MNNVIDITKNFKKLVQAWCCSECNSDIFYLCVGGEIYCAECGVFMEGLEWYRYD